jgi:hypothetical protein
MKSGINEMAMGDDPSPSRLRPENGVYKVPVSIRKPGKIV